MKRVLIAAASVALLSALCPGLALGSVIESDLYDLYIGDEVYAEVVEKVYDKTETEQLTGIPNAYLYLYTVFNDKFDNPGIWCWGFVDHPSTWGATILAWYSPNGWFAPWNCGCLGGVQAGWTGTAAPNGDGVNPWVDPIDYIGLAPTGSGSLDSFGMVSPNPPYKMVQAFAHDGTPVGDCTSSNRYAYGMISAPTPEPVTMALLALGLPAGILLRRRKED